MFRLTALALLGATALVAPAQAQDTWRCVNPECSLLERVEIQRFGASPTSPWEPRHDPWITPQWQQQARPGAPSISHGERLSQQDLRAWYGEPRQSWHADDDRRHRRWRGNNLYD